MKNIFKLSWAIFKFVGLIAFLIAMKKIRTEKGITIPKLVEQTGIPKRTVEDIQRRGDCLVSNAIKLADALGVTLDELCRDNPEQNETE